MNDIVEKYQNIYAAIYCYGAPKARKGQRYDVAMAAYFLLSLCVLFIVFSLLLLFAFFYERFEINQYVFWVFYGFDLIANYLILWNGNTHIRIIRRYKKSGRKIGYKDALIFVFLVMIILFLSVSLYAYKYATR